MSKIVYITNDDCSLRSLGQSLGEEYATERYSPEGSYADDRGLIFIADWEPGTRPDLLLSDFLSNHHLYADCPLLASVESDQLIPACRLLPTEASGLITRPFSPVGLRAAIGCQGATTGNRSDSQFAAAIPFITGTIEVLQQTASTSANCVAIFLARKNPVPNSVASTVTLNGAISGDVKASMSTDLALSLARSITGLPLTDLDQSDALDTAGELLNQITGKVKTIHATLGSRLKCSLPISDSNIDAHTDSSETADPPLQILFQCGESLFSLQLNLAVQSASLAVT